MLEQLHFAVGKSCYSKCLDQDPIFEKGLPLYFRKVIKWLLMLIDTKTFTRQFSSFNIIKTSFYISLLFIHVVNI